MKHSDFLTMIGKLPEKAKLAPVVLEETDMGKYIRKKIEYSAEANERIRAYLGIPKNIKEKAPAVFCYHQHAGNFSLGKSEPFGIEGDPNLAFAHELAELGYITFSPDAIGFEERSVFKKDYWSSIQIMMSRGINGYTLLGKVLFDASAGIDFLQTLPEVDKNRIGFIGHSYGGKMALWLPAFDNRIKASVSNCGCISQKLCLKRDTGIQAEFYIFDMLKYGDIPDVVKLGAKTPLYISATDDDKWSFGAMELYNQVKDSFTPGTIECKVWPGQHVFLPEMRAYAYSFLKKHLT